MPTNNFKLFDENKANLITDTEYANSTQRLNGVQTGVASSQLNNKFAYQVSLVAYAIAQIMNQNNLDASDTLAVSAFVGNLGAALLQKVADKASSVEAAAGVLDNKYITPATMKAAALLLSGGTLTGNLDMGGNKILNLPTPSSTSEPATKGYVDGNKIEVFAEETMNANSVKSKSNLFNSKTIQTIFSKLIGNPFNYGQIFFRAKTNSVTIKGLSNQSASVSSSISVTNETTEIIKVYFQSKPETTVRKVESYYTNLYNWNYNFIPNGNYNYFSLFLDESGKNSFSFNVTSKFIITSNVVLPSNITGTITYQVGAIKL